MSTDPLPDRIPDSILDGREREKRFRAESERLQAAQNEQERRQRDRQAMHEREAYRIDDEIRAALFLRVTQAREATKPQAEVRPTLRRFLISDFHHRTCSLAA